MQSLKQVISNTFCKPFRPDLKKISAQYPDDYASFTKVAKQFKNKPYGKKKVSIYYPGSGSDVATLLLIVNAFCDAKTKHITFICLDNRSFFEGLCAQLKNLAPGGWWMFKNKKNYSHVDILYKDVKLSLIFYFGDANHDTPELVKKGYDMYIERAFEIFRNADPHQFNRIVNLVHSKGLIMSDYGFTEKGIVSQNIRKNFVRLKNIPLKFGLYNQFQIWQKK